VAAAIADWTRIDASAATRLANVQVQLADLPDGVLGLASELQQHIWIDLDAAGYGWSIDEGSVHETHTLSFSGVDLLSVVAHELGHVLGLPHVDAGDQPYDVMADRLGSGVQRLPAGISRFDSPIPAARVTAGPVRVASQLADRLFADLDPQPSDILADQLGSQLRRLPAEIGSPLDSSVVDSPIRAARAAAESADVASGRMVDRLFAALAPRPLTSLLSGWGKSSAGQEQSERDENLLPAATDEVRTAAYRVAREDDERDLAALFDEHSQFDDEAAVLDDLFAEFDQQPDEDETE
jgi:hypothetical protein